MTDFGWEYPPGVTGNEPQITGEWPCGYCGGSGLIETPDSPCPLCKGSGIHPEEAWELSEVMKMIDAFFKNNDWGEVDVTPGGEGYIVIDTNLLVFGSTVIKED